MELNKGMTYAGSGVDIDSANRAKSVIREMVRSTFNANVLSEIGLFGGLYRLAPAEMLEPVLVASADGVGTKLKVAFQADIHHTVGYDLVSHCVNDILVQGAEPLFFLDYIASGGMDPGIVGRIIEGLVKGCREFGCALIGGETAEMPGFYAPGEYDLAGFIVGVVDRPRIINGTAIRPGDVVLGLPSAGLHTNGYSLARKIFFERMGLGVDSTLAELGCSIGEELLKPHRNYLAVLRPCLSEKLVRGLAHITGGGLLENIPRILPAGCGVEIRKGAWPVLSVFRVMAESGRVEEMEMYRVFNMGVGMAVVAHPDDAVKIMGIIRGLGLDVFNIGQVISGNGEVKLI